MRKIQLSALIILAGLSIAAVGSAALSSLTMDRSVSGGQILVDTDNNVAVQITNTSEYEGLVKTDTNGKVTFHLNEAINNNSENGFNTDALFNIGSNQNGVIKIRNNSDVPVSVTMSNTGSDSITMLPVDGSNTTIDVGTADSFYFTVNTEGQKAGKELSAVLHIEGNE